MDTLVTARSAGSVSAWYAMTADEVIKQLATNTESGLDLREAANRTKKYGPNQLPEGKKRGPFTRLLLQFNNILVYVLLGAGFTKLMLSLWIDAAIILGVVMLNGLLGFIQEGRAEKALDSIRNMLSAEARTIRGGEARMIPAGSACAWGTWCCWNQENKVPADLRLTDVNNFRTEEAALTGDVRPGAGKTTDPGFWQTRPSGIAKAWRSPERWLCLVALQRCGGRNRQRHRTRPYQPIARRRRRSSRTPLLRQIKKFGYAITAAVLGGGERAGLRLRQMGAGHAICRYLSGGRWCIARYRSAYRSGLAGNHHDHAGDR